MKKNEATVLDFVSVRWYMYQPMLIYAVLNKELRSSEIVKRPFCSRFLKGHPLTDPEAFTPSSVMDCFLFNSTHFHCSFSGDLFTVSDAWIRIHTFLTVSIVCHHFVTAVVQCMANVFYLLLLIQTSRVHKMEVFVCGSLVMLQKSHHIAHLDHIKE